MNIFLFILWLFWGAISVLFVYRIGESPTELQAYLWCGAGIFIGIMYSFSLLLRVPKQNGKSTYYWGILLLVLVVHFIFWSSKPIKEDDFYRYSWDGRNSRLGEHPYAHEPAYYFKSETTKYNKKINFPQYKTIYPPMAQLLFLSEGLAPDTILGWWLLILFLDFVLVLFTWFYLVKKGIHWHYFGIIWLNPIWLKEGLNSGHLDIIVGFVIWFVVFFSILNSNKYKVIFSILSGIVVGLRPWFALFFIYCFNQKNKLFLIIFGLTFLLPWLVLFSLPNAPPFLESMSSWAVFTKRWEFNSLFYDIFYRLNKIIFVDYFWARWLGWLIGISLMIFIFIKTFRRQDSIFWGCLGVLVWLLFQPTVNAWYFLPMISASSAYLLFHNINEKHYKGVLAAISIALPMSYLHYLDINRDFLDYKWAIAEIMILVLTYTLFVISKGKESSTEIISD